MAGHKVHVIEADMSGGIHDVVKKRDDLGRAIAKMASYSCENVWFHDFKDPVAGAPVLLVECSDDFLERIKKLPGFAKEHDVRPGIETERKPSIMAYFFTTPAASPTPPKKPHGPRP